jgi:Spy/CpxP family protein refolding chaperone
MKRLFSMVAALALILGAASVYADGGGCCAGMSKSSKMSASCGDMMSKLNLTDAQKAKISALKDQTTRAATSTSEAHAMMSKGMEQILTPDQLAQWQSGCEKATKTSSGTGECPFMKSMKKSADKTS